MKKDSTSRRVVIESGQFQQKGQLTWLLNLHTTSSIFDIPTSIRPEYFALTNNDSVFNADGKFQH